MKASTVISLIIVVVGSAALTFGVVWDKSKRSSGDQTSLSVEERKLPNGELIAELGRNSPRSGPVAARITHSSSESRNLSARRPIQQMSPEVEASIEAFREELALQHDDEARYLELMRTERVDPEWSGRTEQLLDDALETRGGSLTAMTAVRPRCVKSICAISLAGGTSSDDPGADLQRTFSEISGEPWFRRNFKDSVMSMGVRDGRVVYSIYLIRKQ